MGSSKKHKEKDKDRDRSKEKRREKDRKRDRSEKDKRRKEEREEREESDRSGGKRAKREEYDESYGHETEKAPQAEAETQNSGGGKEASLSIEETNKLRAKLGLKPLQVDDDSSAKTGEGTKSSGKEDVHVPAKNMGDKRQEEKLKRKLEEMREKRRMNKKLGKVRALGDESDEDVESAAAWVEKNRRAQEEKDLAQKRAQLLAEMDEEFGIGDLIQEEFGHVTDQQRRPKGYTSRDLRGLKVEHSESSFQEGRSVVMTLKDSNVLDEEQDTLMNVNIIDKEKADKNVELRKKKPGYQAYDESEFDDEGMFKPREILKKYDEEIEGEKKKSFVLESGGQFDTTRADEIQRIRSNLKDQMVSLDMAKPKLAAEYYTSEEMVKFKKPKKKRKIRKREVLKADDLEAFADSSPQGDHGSRKSRPAKSASKIAPPRNDDAMEVDLPDPDHQAEILGPDSESREVLFEEDEAQMELQLALERSRRLKVKKEVTGAEKVVEALAAVPKQETERPEDEAITLDSTTEFCRTLGEIPTYGSSGNRESDEEEEEEEEEWNMDVVAEEEEPQGGWEWVQTQGEKNNQLENEEKETNILDAEPMIGSGLAGALQLATKKGLFEGPKHKKEERFAANIPTGVGVIDEDKMRDEEKHRMRSGRDYDRDRDRDRDRYGSSGLEKKGYKPDVKLEYVDDNGRAMTQKEAFRYLSHKFHGKVPGKMKTEKRGKKIQEEAVLMKMSSGDTPLNTTALLIEKQKTAQSPFVILSGGGKTFTTGASISKSK